MDQLVCHPKCIEHGYRNGKSPPVILVVIIPVRAESDSSLEIPSIEGPGVRVKV